MEYAFKYLRAGRVEVERGPFLKKKRAERSKEVMAKMGAICTDVYPMDGNSQQVEILKAEEKGYVEGLLKKFEVYLGKELSVLDGGVGYAIVYSYIRELEKRVKRYVREHNPTPNKKVKCKKMPDDLIKKFTRYGKAYLKGVASILREKSMLYSPADGSVPEDIGNLLRKLSDLFLKK